MKKLFLICVLCCFAGAASAQKVETVRLKNGSVIRGVVIEQIPMQSLKIQTQDGSVFVCTYDEVEKITYEEIKRTPQGAPDLYNRGDRSRSTLLQERVKPRYQGSVDFAYSIGVGKWAVSRIELTTSHGCHIAPYFYAGAGFGMHYYYDAYATAVPIFAEFRSYLTRGDIKPFLNARIGYSFGSVEGLYIAPSIGLSIHRLDFSLGYTSQGVTVDISSYRWKTVNFGAVTFKLGVRF